MYFRKTTFSHVGRLSLSGFDEMSEAVREPGTSLAEKAEQERKCRRVRGAYDRFPDFFSYGHFY